MLLEKKTSYSQNNDKLQGRLTVTRRKSPSCKVYFLEYLKTIKKSVHSQKWWGRRNTGRIMSQSHFFSYTVSYFPLAGLPYQMEKKCLAMATPSNLSLSIYLANGCLLISALSGIPLFRELIFHTSTFLPGNWLINLIMKIFVTLSWPFYCLLRVLDKFMVEHDLTVKKYIYLSCFIY